LQIIEAEQLKLEFIKLYTPVFVLHIDLFNCFDIYVILKNHEKLILKMETLRVKTNV
jgi:hypothetical protein